MQGVQNTRQKKRVRQENGCAVPPLRVPSFSFSMAGADGWALPDMATGPVDPWRRRIIAQRIHRHLGLSRQQIS
jgi:hypothetical protein